MDIEELMKFGLTVVEAKIYLELCKLNKTNIGPIIKKTGFHRGTVYNSINQLIKKGLVGYVEERKIKKFFVKPDSLFSIIQLKRQELVEQEKTVKDFVSELKKPADEAQEVSIHLGRKSFKILYDEISKFKYFFIGDKLEMMGYFGEDYMKKIQKIKRASKIKTRLIVNESISNHRLAKHIYGEIKYVPQEFMFPAATWITNDKVMITIFDTDPITTILINSKNVAKNYQSYFELLWNLPLKFDTKRTYRLRLIKLLNNAKKFDVLCRENVVPFFIYPHNEKDFIKYRKAIYKHKVLLVGEPDLNLYNAYHKSYQRNIKVRIITAKKSLDNYFKIIKKSFGDKELNKRVKKIKSHLKKYKNVEILVLDEFNPISIYMSQRNCLFALPSGEEVFGFSTFGPQVRATFSKLFDEFWKRGIQIEKYLDKIN